MSWWTTLRDDLIPYQWFKHGGNKKDWMRRAAEFPLAMMGAQAIGGTGGGLQSLLGGSPPVPYNDALGIGESGMTGGVANKSLLDFAGSGSGMNQKQMMMAQMAMNMAKPGEAPPPQPGQPPGQVGQLPPPPSLISPTPPMGRGVAGAIEGSAADTPYPGESYADFLERKKRETRGILK